jgi:hypothetical protein
MQLIITALLQPMERLLFRLFHLLAIISLLQVVVRVLMLVEQILAVVVLVDFVAELQIFPLVLTMQL